MKANQTIFSKNVFKISIVFLLLVNISCGEYHIADKDIFQKKIPIFEYYQPSNQIITTNSGFITKISHLTTNGDSLNCEIVGSKEELISKIGFDGKIIWQKNLGFDNFTSKIVEDNEGNFYDFTNSLPPSIRKYDSKLNLVSQIPLKTDEYFKNGEILNGLTYLGSDLLLGFGQSKYKNLGDGNYVSKKFVCLINSKLGVQKFIYDEDETPTNYFSTYFKTTNNEFIGIIYLDRNISKPQIRIQKFDKNLVKIAQKDIDFPRNGYFNNNSINFSNDEMNILYYANGNINLMNINAEIVARNFPIGLSFASNPTFVKNIKNELIFVESSGNGYSNVKKIVKNGDNVSTSIIIESGFNLQNSFIDNTLGNQLLYSIANTGNYNKPSISILNSINDKEINKKVIYQSEYSRFCNNYY